MRSEIKFILSELSPQLKSDKLFESKEVFRFRMFFCIQILFGPAGLTKKVFRSEKTFPFRNGISAPGLYILVILAHFA